MNEPEIITAECLTAKNPATCQTEVVATANAGKKCSSLRIIPEPAFLEVGGTWAFKAIITYDDGTTEEVVAVWSSSDPTVATIDADGLATGVGSGLVTISAAYCNLIATATAEVDVDCADIGLDVVLALCRSSSMNTVEGGRTRIENVADGVKKMLDGLADGDQAGFVSFAGTRLFGPPVQTIGEATLDQPLTDDFASAKLAVDALFSVRGPCNFPDETTGPNSRCRRGIGEALQLAYDEITSGRHISGSRRIIILVVDGRDEIELPDAATIAATIKAAGIHLFIVGIDIPLSYHATLGAWATIGMYLPVADSTEAAEPIARAPFVICSGYSPYGYPYAVYPYPPIIPTDPEEVAGTLAGLRWEMPCRTNMSLICSCVNPADVSAVVGGDPDKIYDITLRIRGLVELKRYTGGTNDGNNFQTGGAPENISDAAWNEYRLLVSDPAQTYYLNRNDGVANNFPSYVVDYECTIQARGGSTVTLQADAIDHLQSANVTNKVVPGVPPNPQVYRGQFLQMDVVSVVEA